MFPVVPTDDTTKAPEDGSTAAPEATAFVAPEPAPPVAPPEPVKMEPATDETFTHYVHLADGRVLRADLSKITEHIGNRYRENAGEDNETSTQIIGVYGK